MKRRKS